ncbi:hypothetical protein HK098_006185 [Nowakowskiella sp. JEL0407]|nr:hypothetical protein HK098_006185 [Nowakowskiella sp. JEL0407]
MQFPTTPPRTSPHFDYKTPDNSLKSKKENFRKTPAPSPAKSPAKIKDPFGFISAELKFAERRKSASTSGYNSAATTPTKSNQYSRNSSPSSPLPFPTYDNKPPRSDSPELDSEPESNIWKDVEMIASPVKSPPRLIIPKTLPNYISAKLSPPVLSSDSSSEEEEAVEKVKKKPRNKKFDEDEDEFKFVNLKGKGKRRSGRLSGKKYTLKELDSDEEFEEKSIRVSPKKSLKKARI